MDLKQTQEESQDSNNNRRMDELIVEMVTMNEFLLCYCLLSYVLQHRWYANSHGNGG